MIIDDRGLGMQFTWLAELVKFPVPERPVEDFCFALQVWRECIQRIVRELIL
ncbi:MAG TPA: hypothetical protein VGK01_23500 [Candidatus Angelobacter sp.]